MNVEAKTMLILLLAILCGTVESQTHQVPWRDEYVLKQPGGIKGEARLEVSPFKLGADEKLQIDVRYTNQGIGHWFFNPFFVSHFPLPAAVAVFDDNKRYLGDYLHADITSQATAGAQSRAFIWTGGYTGVRLTRVAGRIPGMSGNSLPPGRYFLQVVFFDGFISFSKPSKPGMTFEEIRSFYDDFNRSELFRSNVVEIEITPKRQD